MCTPEVLEHLKPATLSGRHRSQLAAVRLLQALESNSDHGAETICAASMIAFLLEACRPCTRRSTSLAPATKESEAGASLTSGDASVHELDCALRTLLEALLACPQASDKGNVLLRLLEPLRLGRTRLDSSLQRVCTLGVTVLDLDLRCLQALLTWYHPHASEFGALLAFLDGAASFVFEARKLQQDVWARQRQRPSTEDKDLRNGRQAAAHPLKANGARGTQPWPSQGGSYGILPDASDLAYEENDVRLSDPSAAEPLYMVLCHVVRLLRLTLVLSASDAPHPELTGLLETVCRSVADDAARPTGSVGEATQIGLIRLLSEYLQNCGVDDSACEAPTMVVWRLVPHALWLLSTFGLQSYNDSVEGMLVDQGAYASQRKHIDVPSMVLSDYRSAAEGSRLSLALLGALRRLPSGYAESIKRSQYLADLPLSSVDCCVVALQTPGCHDQPCFLAMLELVILLAEVRQDVASSSHTQAASGRRATTAVPDEKWYQGINAVMTSEPPHWLENLPPSTAKRLGATWLTCRHPDSTASSQDNSIRDRLLACSLWALAPKDILELPPESICWMLRQAAGDSADYEQRLRQLLECAACASLHLLLEGSSSPLAAAYRTSGRPRVSSSRSEMAAPSISTTGCAGSATYNVQQPGSERHATSPENREAPDSGEMASAQTLELACSLAGADAASLLVALLSAAAKGNLSFSYTERAPALLLTAVSAGTKDLSSLERRADLCSRTLHINVLRHLCSQGAERYLLQMLLLRPRAQDMMIALDLMTGLHVSATIEPQHGEAWAEHDTFHHLLELAQETFAADERGSRRSVASSASTPAPRTHGRLWGDTQRPSRGLLSGASAAAAASAATATESMLPSYPSDDIQLQRRLLNYLNVLLNEHPRPVATALMSSPVLEAVATLALKPLPRCPARAAVQTGSIALLVQLAALFLLEAERVSSGGAGRDAEHLGRLIQLLPLEGLLAASHSSASRSADPSSLHAGLALQLVGLLLQGGAEFDLRCTTTAMNVLLSASIKPDGDVQTGLLHVVCALAAGASSGLNSARQSNADGGAATFVRELAEHPWNLFALEQAIPALEHSLADVEGEQACLYWATVLYQRPSWSHALTTSRAAVIRRLVQMLVSSPLSESHLRLLQALQSLGVLNNGSNLHQHVMRSLRERLKQASTREQTTRGAEDVGPGDATPQNAASLDLAVVAAAEIDFLSREHFYFEQAFGAIVPTLAFRNTVRLVTSNALTRGHAGFGAQAQEACSAPTEQHSSPHRGRQLSTLLLEAKKRRCASVWNGDGELDSRVRTNMHQRRIQAALTALATQD